MKPISWFVRGYLVLQVVKLEIRKDLGKLKMQRIIGPIFSFQYHPFPVVLYTVRMSYIGITIVDL